MGIIIDLGGNPEHDRIGFRYWKHPYGPMAFYLLKQVHNKHLAIFLGFWSTLTNALFAFIGTELIGVTVGEAENPRRNIPIAIRRTFFRILVFYIGGVFVIGLLVPSTNQVSLGRFTRDVCSEASCVSSRSSSQLRQSPALLRRPSWSVSTIASETWDLLCHFALATTLVGIKVLNHIINAAILVFVSTVLTLKKPAN